MLSVLAHNHTKIDFKMQLAVGDIFYFIPVSLLV